MTFLISFFTGWCGEVYQGHIYESIIIPLQLLHHSVEIYEEVLVLIALFLPILFFLVQNSVCLHISNSQYLGLPTFSISFLY
uniref:Uncharacterized protein n=1 Tax=Rhizophora mucronata TaxID=61149 RepID=A0A2P2KQE3_RHIMU